MIDLVKYKIPDQFGQLYDSFINVLKIRLHLMNLNQG